MDIHFIQGNKVVKREGEKGGHRKRRERERDKGRDRCREMDTQTERD